MARQTITYNDRQDDDGWNTYPGTWTYASASTFTAGGNQTALFVKGMRIKWTQTTVKYGVVLSSSYGAPNTTVTIAVNTSYTIANAEITLPAWSLLAAPIGWPGWFNYTTTWGGFSADPSPAVMRYSITGNICHVETFTALAGIGTSNATTFTMTLPITATSTAPFPVSVIYDNDALVAHGYGMTNSSSTTANIYRSLGANFTASGGKRCGFRMFYVI
jgi:hypothetical protein